MVAIIGCESGFTQYTKDGNVLRGRVDAHDSGASQINTRYHPDADVESIWGNLAYARKLYDAQGVDPWVCDRKI